MKALKGILIGSLLGALLLLGAPSSALADKTNRWDNGGQDVQKGGAEKGGAEKGDAKHGGDKNANKGDNKGDKNADKNADKGDKKNDNKRDENKSADKGEKRNDGHDGDRANQDYYYDGYYYGPGYYGCGYSGDCGYYDGYYGESTSTFYARMTGDQVVPNPGPPGARGNAQFDVNPAEHRVCFNLSYQGIDHPTSGHIHRGRRDEAGPVAVDLRLEANGNQGCVGAPYGVLRAMQADPHGFYVNLHTKEFPDGAMRGQLVSPGEGGY
jgi:hypothetical protein